MSEYIKHHEIIRPIREIGQFVVGWAKDIVVPPQALEFISDEVTPEPRYFQPPLPYDSEGNWHNPDGEN